MNEVLQYSNSSSSNMDENGEPPKRPRYESQQQGGAVGYATPTSQQQASQPMAVSSVM